MFDIWIESPTAAVLARSSPSQDEKAILAWVRHALNIKIPQRNTMNEVVLLRATLHPAQLESLKTSNSKPALGLLKLSPSIWQT